MSPSARPTIALVSRELEPFFGGGIGTYVAAAATLLSRVADVTVLTSSYNREAFERLKARQDPRIDYGGAHVMFVEEPAGASLTDFDGFYGVSHLYAARVLEALRAQFPFRGPDLIEAGDYHAEGFAVLQAQRSHDPWLAKTRLLTRLHTSAEMCNVLDGEAGDPVTHHLERAVLRESDALVAPSPEVAASYARFFDGALAPRVTIPYPLRFAGSGRVSTPRAGGPLKMVFIGRMERRKGIHRLLAALTAIDGPWELTILGGDTETGPDQTSMRAGLEMLVASDRRVHFHKPVRRDEVHDLLIGHDLAVVPSVWECWPGVAYDAMAAGLPILATPVGGLADMVVDGQTGWLTAGNEEADLFASLRELVAAPGTVRALVGSPAITARLAELADPTAILDAYAGQLAEAAGRSAPARRSVEPLVSIVIPYRGLPGFVEETVASCFVQDHPRIEVILVSDGAFDPQDWVLAELSARYPIMVVAQPNGGLGAARNFGIGQSSGRYVLPLDADNTIAPTFVSRCVGVLESEPEAAYATSWTRWMDPRGRFPRQRSVGYNPLGNASRLVDSDNVAGDACAVLRRRLFDVHSYDSSLTSFEDWAFYRRLAADGLYGRIIPERLINYRVRGNSMLQTIGVPHRERLRAEVDAAS